VQFHYVKIGHPSVINISRFFCVFLTVSNYTDDSFQTVLFLLAVLSLTETVIILP